MNTALITNQPAADRAHTRPRRGRVQVRRSAETTVLRTAQPADAIAIHGLIEAHLAEGHLLRRSLSELTTHAARFIVAVRETPASPKRAAGHRASEGGARRPGTVDIVGCAELAPLSGRVAEVRSLVVDRSARSLGIGRRLVEELRRKAARDGFETLCAFTHDAGYFVRKGFSIVPHVWVPEKIALDCHECALFRRCGQHAVVLPLVSANRRASTGDVPLAALRG